MMAASHTDSIDEADARQCPILLQRYVLSKFLGAGCYAVVYSARDLITGADVAIKLLRPQWSHAKSAMLRVRMEANAYRMLAGEQIPSLRQEHRLPDGRPFLVLDLVHGITLDRLLRTSELPISAVLDLGYQLLAVLARVHRMGFVHGDVMPKNVMLEPHPHLGAMVKLIDLASCKHIQRGRHVFHIDVERSHEMDWSYASPEQVERRETDIRSDLYAVAAVLHRALAGIPYPSSLERVLNRALSPNPNGRYASAEQLGSALFEVMLETRTAKGRAAWQQTRWSCVADDQPVDDTRGQAVSTATIACMLAILALLVAWLSGPARTMSGSASTPPEPELTHLPSHISAPSISADMGDSATKSTVRAREKPRRSERNHRRKRKRGNAKRVLR